MKPNRAPAKDASQVWLNGQRLTSAALDADSAGDPLIQLECDRGLHYGHGVFETIRVSASKNVAGAVHFNFLKGHLQRLRRGLIQLGFFSKEDPSAKIDDLLETIQTELKTLSLSGNGIFKIIVTAGSSERGYGCSDVAAPRRLYFWSPSVDSTVLDSPTSVSHSGDLPSFSNANLLNVLVCQHRLGRNAALAGIKHLNRLEQVLGANEVLKAGLDDGLMLDHDGQLVEATSSNIFLVKAGQIFTPDLTQCGIAGVLRSAILNSAAFYEQSGTLIKPEFPTVIVRSLSLADLLSADEVFITNCVKGIRPIGRVFSGAKEMTTYQFGPLTKRVSEWLNAVLQEQRL